MSFIQLNVNDIKHRECSLLGVEEWFVNSARVSFIIMIDSLNKMENNFNGVEYLFNIRVLYTADSEMDEFVRGVVAKMAYDSPSKFIAAVEHFDGAKEFLFYPYWEIIDINNFREKVLNSGYYTIIDSVLINYE
jgi:hypothetical protein